MKKKSGLAFYKRLSVPGFEEIVTKADWHFAHGIKNLLAGV